MVEMLISAFKPESVAVKFQNFQAVAVFITEYKHRRFIRAKRKAIGYHCQKLIY